MQITTLGTEFAVAEMLGTALGFWLDRKWGTTPWMLLAGVAAGFALGFYIVLRAAKDMEKQIKTQQVKKRNGRS